jgi:FAD/FMN-containing dehydrogenase
MEARCPGARIVAFGHMGDGNFHYTAMQPRGMSPADFPAAALTQTVYEIATALGGSISAEHGIGIARKEDLVRFKRSRIDCADAHAEHAQSIRRT